MVVFGSAVCVECICGVVAAMTLIAVMADHTHQIIEQCAGGSCTACTACTVPLRFRGSRGGRGRCGVCAIDVGCEVERGERESDARRDFVFGGVVIGVVRPSKPLEVNAQHFGKRLDAYAFECVDACVAFGAVVFVAVL